MASFAALIPLAIIAPKVGPIRFDPSCSESSMPGEKYDATMSATRRVGLKSRKRTCHDEPWDDLARAVDDGRLCTVHVEATHVAQLFEQSGADEALRGEGTHRTVMACIFTIVIRTMDMEKKPREKNAHRWH